MRNYSISLTFDDLKAIEFSGHRYNWSRVMLAYTIGTNWLEEREAWEIIEALEIDTNDWSTDIPLLSDNSNLYREFMRLHSEVI